MSLNSTKHGGRNARGLRTSTNKISLSVNQQWNIHSCAILDESNFFALLMSILVHRNPSFWTCWLNSIALSIPISLPTVSRCFHLRMHRLLDIVLHSKMSWLTILSWIRPKFASSFFRLSIYSPIGQPYFTQTVTKRLLSASNLGFTFNYPAWFTSLVMPFKLLYLSYRPKIYRLRLMHFFIPTRIYSFWDATAMNRTTSIFWFCGKSDLSSISLWIYSFSPVVPSHFCG